MIETMTESAEASLNHPRGAAPPEWNDTGMVHLTGRELLSHVTRNTVLIPLTPADGDGEVNHVAALVLNLGLEFASLAPVGNGWRVTSP